MEHKTVSVRATTDEMLEQIKNHTGEPKTAILEQLVREDYYRLEAFHAAQERGDLDSDQRGEKA
jgi:Holliday junction resolvasome RuvABC DNA-binding subunit